MKGGRIQKSQKNDKKMSKIQVDSDVNVAHGEDGNGKAASGKATEANVTVNQNTLLESLALLSKELKDFKQDMRQDLSEF